MLKKLPKENMGHSNLGWLESRFHFSFAQYFNPNNMHFGVLRVLNDDIIHSMSCFDTHPHKDMEIISYIVSGEISHKDSMGHTQTLQRGEVQYLSAGNGIYHSEHNQHPTQDLRLLQIWILPPKEGMDKLYGSYRFAKEDRTNKLSNIVSSQEGNAKIKIYQDVNIYVSELDASKNLDFTIKNGRQIYFVQIEGSATINEIAMENGDAMEITDEKNIKITAVISSHFIFIEMAT